MVTKIHWDSTDLASQALVDAMIEDIGLDDDDADERVKKASRVYALSLLGADCMEIGNSWLAASLRAMSKPWSTWGSASLIT